MVNRLKFYIDGQWVDPVSKKTLPVVNPANEDQLYEITKRLDEIHRAIRDK